MATKEQLAKIFALEIRSMQDEIEALDRIAKRSGNLRDPARREADRQVGWAYRLLQEYGATEELSFAQGSETREALLEAGADEDDIPFIAATYQGERADALSSRSGQTRSPFLQDVLHRMAQVGLDDTVLNREATTEEIFRARADALLASSNDPRKPKLGETDRLEQAQVETIAVAPQPRPTPIWNADPEPPPALAESTGIVLAPVPEVQPTIPQPKPSKVAKPRTNLPLSDFDNQLEDLIANKQDEWEEDTAADVRVLVGIFRGILEEHDVTHSGEITQEHVAALRQHFNHILPSYGRSPRLRVLSSLDLREESRRRAEEAEAKGEKPVRLGLKPATIRRHLGNLDHFLKHLRASHIMVGEWTFEGLRPKKPSKGEIRLQRQISTGEFNRSSQHLLQPIGRGLEVQGFSGSLIEPQSDVVELILRDER